MTQRHGRFSPAILSRLVFPPHTTRPFAESTVFHISFLPQRNGDENNPNTNKINETMFDKSTSLSATTTSAGQESTRNHQEQEQGREQEQQQEWQDNFQPSAEAFLWQPWPAPLRPSSVYVTSSRSNTVPSLPRLLPLDQENDHETAPCWHHARHEQEPGAHRDFLLAVIDSALEILDNYGEDKKESTYQHHESNIRLHLPQ